MQISFYDIETSGLSAGYDDVLQVAILRMDSETFEVSQARNFYFYNENQKFGAEHIHGISLNFLKQFKDDFYKNMNAVYALLNQTILCGHNIESFDTPFLYQWFKKYGLDQFMLAGSIDTLSLYKEYSKKSIQCNPNSPFRNSPSVKLDGLPQKLGMPTEWIKQFASIMFDDDVREAHDARYDVAATYLIYRKGKEEGWF